jgi:hypothetical protein
MTEELKEIGLDIGPRRVGRFLLGDVNITCRSTGAVSNRMKRDLAVRASKMAIAFRAPPKGCIYYPAGDCKVICREGIIPTVAAKIVRMTTRNPAPAWVQGVHERQGQLL